MSSRVVMLSIAILTGYMAVPAIGAAHADKLALPAGNWTYPPAKAAECKNAPLTIENNRLIQRIDQEGIRGEARCRFLRIKMGQKGYIYVKTKCDWDRHIPQAMRESPDNDDDEEFSVKIISKNKIIFNNVEHEICPPKVGDIR
ncbi:hypothetical protein [Methylobacterium indicum]|uniref:hypothetical protein n=1 Tax=Methylobacterium indicum TaxID=1775910 RepID=UPI000AC1F514|nr:hypothetical protein [Methylobacterium indicum]